MSKPRFIEVNGECLRMSEWAKRNGIPMSLICKRLKKGWPPELAVSPKLRPRSFSQQERAARKRESQRKWREKNPGHYSEYRKKNSDRLREVNRIWRERVKDRRREKNREYRRDRYQKDVQFKLRCNLRLRLRLALKGRSKALGTVRLVGCSLGELAAHLESQFEPWMTWENHGKEWDIDHIVPLSAVDLSDEKMLLAVSNWRNLAPLGCKENRHKKRGLMCKKTFEFLDFILKELENEDHLQVA